MEYKIRMDSTPPKNQKIIISKSINKFAADLNFN